MELSDGEVDLHEVLEWAQEQSQFLRSPAQRLVLWYLCINAWRHEKNRQGGKPGDVIDSCANIIAVRKGTGLSERGVRDALRDLQRQGYLIADLQPGNGHSTITVFWSAGADARRADFRAGYRDLPKGFQRPEQEEVERPPLASVINFPNRQGLPQ